MPYQLAQEGDLLRLRLYGTLTHAGLLELGQDIAEFEARSPVAPHRLTDMRDSTGIELNFSAMLALGRVRTAASLPNPVKSAMIAPDPILYGFARMFQTLNANPSITVAIFPSEESALAWLSEPGLASPAEPWVPGG